MTSPREESGGEEAVRSRAPGKHEKPRTLNFEYRTRFSGPQARFSLRLGAGATAPLGALSL